MGKINLIGCGEFIRRNEGNVTIKICRCVIGIIAFSQCNDDRIDAFADGILQIEIGVFVAYLSNKRPGCVSINEKWSVVLVHKISLVCTSF